MDNIGYKDCKKNIRQLINDNKMTQQEFSEIVGMSQSNVSKSLNEDDKRFFTVEQLCRIADHFNVSTDQLLGREKKSPVDGVRGLAKFLAYYLENGDARIHLVKKSEPVWEPFRTLEGYSTRMSEYDVEYPMIYFPSYWDPGEVPVSNQEDREALYSEVRSVGNETKYVEFNSFLKEYIEIVKIYRKGKVSNKALQAILNDFLSGLRNY